MELLVVIAVIGLFAAVILASLNSARTKSRDSKRVVDLKSLRTALEMYYDTCRQYPSTLALATNNGCPSGTTFGSFISVLPIDPLSGSYKYTGLGNASPLSCNSYHLGANLEDKTNQSLSTDIDASAATACSGTDFNGVANESACVSNCDCAASVATRYCYDIKP